MDAEAQGYLIPLLPYNGIDNVLYSAPVGFHPEIRSLASSSAELDLARDRQSIPVFPSHFFEFSEKAVLMNEVRSRGLRCFIQISPGAELLERFDELMKMDPSLVSLEWFMDRVPHPEDLLKIRKLCSAGYEMRYVFMPVREIDAYRAFREMPPWIRDEMYFYFPPQDQERRSFLGADEIFVLCRDLRAEFPDHRIRTLSYLRNHEQGVLKEREFAKNFRFSPDERAYRENFERLGDHPKTRRVLHSMSDVPSLRRALRFVLLGIWFSRDPLEVFRMLGTALYWKFRRAVAVAEQVYWQATRVYWWATRIYWRITKIYWSATRVYWWARSLVLQAYFFLKGMIRAYSDSPVWATKAYFPPVYWVFVFPFQKLYWYARYKVKGA